MGDNDTLIFNNRRNFIMGGVTLGAGAASLMIPGVVSAAVPVNDRFITVGNGGTFVSLHEAAAAAGSLNPTDSNWAVICMMPGNYDLSLESTELILPDFTELTGVSRHGCVVLGNGNKNIRVNAHNRISNCTIRYTGFGNRSGAVRQQDVVTTSMNGLLDIDGVDFDVYATAKCAVWVQAIIRCYIRNCFIQTSGVGLDILSGYTFISGTHCRLVSNAPSNSNPHHAIRQTQSGSRVWVDGGTWATGYGSPELDGEPGANVVMFHAAATSTAQFGARIELNNVWSITRNNAGTNIGTKVTCVDVAVPGAWVRVRGGYFQGEDINGHAYDLMNSGNGRLEIQSARYKSLFGNSYSANGDGVRMITDAIYAPKFNDDGIKVIDAAQNPGGMIIKLSAPGISQVMGAEQVIVRIDNTGSLVTIDGNGKLINGASTRKLGSAQYSKMVLRYVGGTTGWLVLNE